MPKTCHPLFIGRYGYHVIPSPRVRGKSRQAKSSARSHLHPVQAGHSLWLENTDNAPDIMVRDSDLIPNGARLYSIPPAIMGG